MLVMQVLVCEAWTMGSREHGLGHNAKHPLRQAPGLLAFTLTWPLAQPAQLRHVVGTPALS